MDMDVGRTYVCAWADTQVRPYGGLVTYFAQP